MAGLIHRAFTENKKLGMLIVFSVFTTTGSSVPLLVTGRSSQQPGSPNFLVSLTRSATDVYELFSITDHLT